MAINIEGLGAKWRFSARKSNDNNLCSSTSLSADRSACRRDELDGGRGSEFGARTDQAADLAAAAESGGRNEHACVPGNDPMKNSIFNSWRRLEKFYSAMAHRRRHRQDAGLFLMGAIAASRSNLPQNEIASQCLVMLTTIDALARST